MIAKIKLRTYGDRWGKLTPEEYDELRQVMPDLPEEKPSWYDNEKLVDLDLVTPTFNKLNLEVELVPFKNMMLVSLKDEIRRLSSEQKMLRQELYSSGDIVQIHVPNIGLIAMNDACTDALQEALDEGWCLLAVCPPNAQRRPDYILGRSNPKREKR